MEFGSQPVRHAATIFQKITVCLHTGTEKSVSKGKGRAAAGLPPAATVPDPSSSSSSSDEEDAGGTQVNADTLPPAIAGSCEPPSTTSSGSSSGEEEVQPTQVAGAVHDDEGDPTHSLSPPISLDRLVQSLCGESTDGASS